MVDPSTPTTEVLAPEERLAPEVVAGPAIKEEEMPVRPWLLLPLSKLRSLPSLSPAFWFRGPYVHPVVHQPRQCFNSHLYSCSSYAFVSHDFNLFTDFHRFVSVYPMVGHLDP